MAAAMKSAAGFTLLELLMVVAIISILACAAGWGYRGLLRDWQLKRAGEELSEGLKAAQARSENAGATTLQGGRLAGRGTFLVFDEAARSYAAFDWSDADGDAVVEAGESRRLWRQTLPSGVDFGRPAAVDRRACSNSGAPPTAVISFASPNYPPCNDRPCLRFNGDGFSVIGPGAIYLRQGERALALSATRPGHFTLCAWNGVRWR
jgi:prepilin-type N-terminal cleavage/methylation domain-containing protein